MKEIILDTQRPQSIFVDKVELDNDKYVAYSSGDKFFIPLSKVAYIKHIAAEAGSEKLTTASVQAERPVSLPQLVSMPSRPAATAPPAVAAIPSSPAMHPVPSAPTSPASHSAPAAPAVSRLPRHLQLAVDSELSVYNSQYGAMSLMPPPQEEEILISVKVAGDAHPETFQVPCSVSDSKAVSVSEGLSRAIIGDPRVRNLLQSYQIVGIKKQADHVILETASKAPVKPLEGGYQEIVPKLFQGIPTLVQGLRPDANTSK